MEKNNINFSLQSQSTIIAGNGTRNDSVNFGTSLGKVFISHINISSRYVDAANNTLVSSCITQLTLTTLNSGNRYGITIPGFNVGVVNTLDFCFQYSYYFKTAFIIQPGDQFRSVVNYYTSPLAVNNISCTTFYNFIGYTIN